MVKTQDAASLPANYGGIEFSREQARNPIRKVVGLVAVAAVAVIAMTAVAVTQSVAFGGVTTQELAGSTVRQTVRYGDTVSLQNVYNNYVVVSPNGRTYTGGYQGANDRIRIVSSDGKAGNVQYGDTIALVGSNNRYFTAKYTAKITCHSAVITDGSKFFLVGGSGPVMVGDKIAFKTMYGFMTGSPEGIAADTPTISAAEQYTIGIPGQEVGLAARPGLQYGQTITLRNPENEFLQSDPNGWVYIRGSNGDWNHFDVLSPLHRQGLVEFGDEVILRAHNTKMISTNGDGQLLAAQLIPDQNCIFTLIGAHGVIHNQDQIALRGYQGYVNGRQGGSRAVLDTSGHYQPSDNFILEFNLRQKM